MLKSFTKVLLSYLKKEASIEDLKKVALSDDHLKTIKNLENDRSN